MSKTFSSRKPSSLPPPKAIGSGTSCAKKKQSPRSPLQDLNRISSSSNSSYASSNVSTEAPKGCLRFLTSSSFKTPASHRPKCLSKTPNSVPDAFDSEQTKSKPSKENLSKGSNADLQTKGLAPNKARTCRKKNPPCLYQWQSGKKSGSRTGEKSRPCSVLNENGKFLTRLPPESEELKGKEDSRQEKNDDGGEHCDVNLTPLSEKVRGLSLDRTVHEDVEENPNASISITPPIHNSVSPEVQCGSSLVSTTTPACYGAGYVVSGVTDKRKCRPRGILTVEENYSSFDKTPANSFDDDDEKKLRDVEENVSPSLLPLPAEALVHWLSSPHNKGKKVLSPRSDSGVNRSQGLAESAALSSSTSPSCSSKSFWNIGDSSDLSAAYCIRRKVSSSTSPSGLSEFQEPSNSILSPSYPSILFSSNSILSCRAGSSEKGENHQYNPIDDNSPFSLNSLGSGNVIQTPQSDSSSDLHVALSLAHTDDRKKDSSNPALNSISEVFMSENFHLNSSAPLEDSVNSSFQFDCLAVPCESIDLSKLPKFSDDQDPWLSSSTIENASQSQMRISWREGLISQPYDLDEFDCCRCLSDEEDLANDSSSNRLSVPQVNAEVEGSEKLNSDVVITGTEDDELEIDVPGKEIFPALISYSGSEPVSTDGGGLVASKDGSDWTQCYKNKLFDE